ncbi:hypothetical protein D3C85_1902450 [compost metagenome]
MDELHVGHILFFHEASNITVHEGAFLNRDRFTLQISDRSWSTFFTNQVTDIVCGVLRNGSCLRTRRTSKHRWRIS